MDHENGRKRLLRWYEGLRLGARLGLLAFLGFLAIRNWEDVVGTDPGFTRFLRCALVVLPLALGLASVLVPERRRDVEGTGDKGNGARHRGEEGQGARHRGEGEGVSLWCLLFALLCVVGTYVCSDLIILKLDAGKGILGSVLDSSYGSPRNVALNLFFISLLTIFFLGVWGSLKRGALTASLLVILFSAVNYYVNEFRGTAVTASDFLSLGTAADVAGEYSFSFEYLVLVAFSGFAFLFCLGYRIHRDTPVHGYRRVFLFVGCTLAFALCCHLFVFSSWLRDMGLGMSYWNPMRSYRSHGMMVTLVRSISEALPKMPEGYSPERAREIAEKVSPTEGTRETLPNVIVVIDESFADLSLVGSFKPNEDPIPFVHACENQGVAVASVLGGRTANTEFEFLTGLSMAFLPGDAVPFQIYVKGEMPSLATVMSSLSFAGVEAFHPYSSGNYNRRNVYPRLGFARSHFRDTIGEDLSLLRTYPSDESDVDFVISRFEQVRRQTQAPFFFYNMTVQNHSPFTAQGFEETIRVKKPKKQYPEVNQYLSLTHYSDAAFERLAAYFEKTGEPTVILFFGDHQPKLPNAFVKKITKGRSYENSWQKTLLRYQVPVVLWSNIPLGEVPIHLSSMNYLQADLLAAIGARLTPFQTFLLELQKEVPVINVFGYVGSDGNWYEVDDRESPYYERVQAYAILSYNALFDRENRLEGFFD